MVSWSSGFLVSSVPRLQPSKPEDQQTNAKVLVSCSAQRPLRSALRHHSAPLPRLSNPFRGAAFWQFGRAANFSRHTKSPFLLQKLAPKFWREECRTGVLSEENRIERTTANSRASARKKDETMGADWAIPVRVPEHLPCKGPAQFFAAACEISPDRRPSGVRCAVGAPAALERRSSARWHTHARTKCSGSPGAAGGSPDDGSAQSRNSTGKTAGLTCWNPMATSSRESCSLARSRLSDAYVEETQNPARRG